MKKLLFAALIAVAATIVLLPCTAGAISIPGGVITGTTLPDAVKYMFLANAGVSDMTYSTYVGHGGKSYYKYKITLTQDVEVLSDIKITDYGNLEIDLLEHTVKANQSVNCLFDVDTGSSESDGILTIKGLKGSKVVSNTGHTVHLSGKYAVFYLNPGNNIFALDTEIENSGTDGCAVMVENRGQAYLNDATLSMTDANSDMAGLYYTGSATLVEIKNINVRSKAAYGIRRVGDEYAILKILLNKMLLNGLKGFWITGRTYSIDAQEVIVENGLALTCEWTTGYTGGTRMTIRTTGPVFGNVVYSLSLPTSVEGGSVAAAPNNPLGTTVYPEGYDALKNLFPLLNVNVAFTPDEGYYFESATVTGVGGISAADLGNGVYRFPMPQESASLIDVVFKKTRRGRFISEAITAS